MEVLIPIDSKSYRSQVKAAGTNFVPLSALDNPASGSKWGHPEILTFRVLLEKSDGFPWVLKPFLGEAEERLKSEVYGNIVALVKDQPWIRSPRDTLRRTGKEFGSFLSHLAEIVEEPWSSKRIPGSDRPKRDKPIPQYYMPSDDEEDLARSKASTEEHEEQIAESSDNSDRSHEDQDTLNRQNKSETVTNCLIIEYLQSLASCTSGSDDREFHLEWTMDQDTFGFKVPAGSGLNSRNDGGLVHRRVDGQGHWTRVAPLSCYCSIEAKAAHFAKGKKIEVYAQEVSQIVGMIHQRENLSRRAGVPQRSTRVIPLISISQHFVFVTIAQYNPDYYHFLCTGDERSEPFLQLTEYGGYKLTNHKRLKTLSQIMVALMLFLEEAGPYST